MQYALTKGFNNNNNNMKHYDENRMKECLSKIDFPADKKTIIEQARGMNIDNQELRTLSRIEEKTYTSPEEVTSALDQGSERESNNNKGNNKGQSSQQNQQKQPADAMA